MKRACPRCGEVRRMTADHVVPISYLRRRGVPSEPINLQPLCEPCNKEKANGPPVDYRSAQVRRAHRRWLVANGLGHVKVEKGVRIPSTS